MANCLVVQSGGGTALNDFFQKWFCGTGTPVPTTRGGTGTRVRTRVQCTGMERAWNPCNVLEYTCTGTWKIENHHGKQVSHCDDQVMHG